MLDLESIERSVEQHGWGSVGDHAKALIAEVRRLKAENQELKESLDEANELVGDLQQTIEDIQDGEGE